MKEKLIRQIINDGKEGLEKTLKDFEERLADFKKNGPPKEMHPEMAKGHEASLTYTQGYCIGHLSLLEEINDLLSMNTDDIRELIKENEKISEANRKHLDEVFSRIQKKFSDGKARNSNDSVE